ncbi:CocE/NonD family hydrolase, partial [Clavibacter nebraskensis]
MTDTAGETTQAEDSVTHRDVWIPMPDGTPLHARVWAPATDEPVPALLEYLPYRLDDWTAPRDSERHPWYAAHGYASIRVDIRGTGSSDGLFVDEYSAQELDDGVAVIEWIAAQDWCTGAVGIFGISWGGFNGLQLAARAPEALKAIVTVCSTDDRFDNDVHYMGGAVLGIDMAAWGATMFAFNSRPPRPEVVGDGWVERWRERLDANRPMTPTWLAHQERDDYWRHGSVCEDYSSIDAAVLAVGGWADPYRDAVLRLVENLSSPVKGIVGPWSHQYPDRGLTPGPSIGFLQETLRWWDRWLKGIDTGVEADPALRAFVSDSEPPATAYPERTGRWVAAESWPPPASVAA